MKKKYISPTATTIVIATQQMLATSAPFGSGMLDGSNAAAPEFEEIIEDF